MIHPIEQFTIDFVIKLKQKHNLRSIDIANIINTSGSFIGNVESPTNPAKYNLKHINSLAAYFKISPQCFLPDAAFRDKAEANVHTITSLVQALLTHSTGSGADGQI
ncbi:hypothetical protein OQY15_09790 [Pedobacter sp. MC2016-15]|uniref:hypothetical protein n=1 Tax=Pedobacter sp. MC2016-15 TaxID=2994473 RepID=UPI002245C7B3|nr:hypothetical protein [Pedobacter sp. MC2016-15]MCX2479380.1 hypothetical protein [Pedobacter sp. MC2016-15]